MPLVYASGPISDQDYRGATNWYDVVEATLNPHIHLIKPMRGKEFLKHREDPIGFDAHDDIYSTRAAIFGRDYWDTTRCDAVLMNLIPSTQVSIGCMIEVGWLGCGGTPLVLCAQHGNIHEGHPILERRATYRVTCLEDAIEVLNTLFANG